jgi:hypothetical protein
MSPALAVLAALASSLSSKGPLQEAAGAVVTPDEFRLGPWYVLGPFDNPKGVDVTVELGPEKHLRRLKAGEAWSALGETYSARGKTKIAWSQVPADESKVPPGATFATGTLDFHALLDVSGAAGDHAAAFLYRTIECDAARTVELFCGSDDGLRLWLDGKVLIENSVARALGTHDERLTLALTPGVHHLLVKVTNLGGAWSFAMAEPRAAAPEDVNRAIERGVARLLELQLIDGSWGERRDEYPNGQTGLALYTLVKCGLSPRHRALQQALECIQATPAEKTYALACQILAAAALRDESLRPWIAGEVARLLAWQDENGGWSYPSDQTDLSNTHLAAFSLRAAVQAGVEVPARVWNDLAGYALRNQESRRKDAAAGFTYFPGHETGYTGSMSAAGIAVLACAREALGERMLPNTRLQVEPAIEAGLTWLERHWSVTRNPNKGDWHYYYLYALERVGALLELERVGAHDWYAEGADFLVSAQDADGGWGAECDTCFALLFLRRATALPLSEETKLEGQLFATPEGEPLRLRVKLGPAGSLWIEAPGLAKGTTVTRVEFFARLEQGEWRSLGVGERELAVRYRFERPGRWEARAEARVSDGSTLASSVLAFTSEEGRDPERMGYARDAQRNLLPGLKPEVRASSALEPAANAVDNKVWTRWLCETSDADPWLEIDPKKPAEVARIVLTHARTTAAAQRYANPRPAEIELWLNKEKAPRTVAIATDPGRKTVIELAPPVALARLKLRVTAVEGGTLGQASVGFGELEMQGP